MIAPTGDPMGSFYAQKCSATDGGDGDSTIKAESFEISWGYNHDADSAVMTVC